MKLLHTCFSIVDHIDNVNAVIEQLPRLSYILTYHKNQPDFIYIGFVTPDDTKDFMDLGRNLRDVEEIDEEILQFEFRKGNAAISNQQGTRIPLKKFQALFTR